MSSNSDDIQAAGSDTHPPMLDRTDYKSWSQRIRLCCRGKENGLQILQSIDQGPFELGTTRDALRTTPEGGVLLGPERPRTYEDLSDTEKKRYDTDLVNDMRSIRMTMPNIQLNSKFVNNMSPEWDRFVTAVKLNKGLKETNHEQLYAYLKQHEKHVAQDRLIIERITPATNDQLAFVSTVQPHAQSSHVQSHQYPSSSTNPQSPQYLQFPKTSQIDSGYTQTDELLDNLTKQMALLAQSFRAMLPQTNNQLRTSSNTRNQATIQDGQETGMQAQENGAIFFLDEEELLFLAGEQGNTFDADVDNQPVQDLALNEDNIFQADECDAFDSDVDDEPTAQSIFMANLSSVGSANPQAGPSNASILSEVHILENAIDHSNVIHMNNIFVRGMTFLLPSCASSALNSVCVSPVNDAFVPHDPIATELKIYKEQVAIYEQRAKFELTEREQRMVTNAYAYLKIVIETEEILKELHSFKLQLKSTMENNKIIEETVTTLKQEFKQKESKFLTDFSNLKHLNDKLENKLHSQDQSIQTVHMMLNPTQVYDQKTKTALGAQNPFYLKQAKKAQPALYDGDELLKPHHVPVIVSTSEEELELAEATRNKLHVKMNDSVCVEKRVNITPPNYSKENFMATFTPQTQLTPEQVFWSLDLAKRKAEELKANATPLPVLPPATVYPPNTPAHLVPRTLPTTSQVNIEHFEGIQKSLVTEVRAMKAVFENLEAEVDQNETDLQSGEIERKNLLITNENLNKDLTTKLNALHDLNECFRAENAKVKQHYKELILPLGDQWPLTRNTPPKVLPTKQWKPTGRLLLLGRQCPLVRSTALKSDCWTDGLVSLKHTLPSSETLDGVDLIKGSRGTNLYTISVEDMMRCYVRPAKMQSINGKKYSFGNSSMTTQVYIGKFLRSKDETPAFVINLLKQLQVGLNKTVRFVRTDNGTEFVNKDLTDFYESVGITHEKTVPRTPQQNGVVERRNRTLVEAARTMLIFSKAPLFLWAEAVATACYTQNRSLIHTLHNKTPYELVHDKKPDLSFLRIFGALCYPTNDNEDLGKLKAKADIGFFVGYAPNRKGYRIYNKRTRQIMETIHVTFDELTEQTAPVHSSSGPNPNLLTPGPISSGLVPNSAPAIPYVPPTNKDLELLFQLK
ncbi:retrovirus-related pol polyprotein from transposon TNT 1-94 [Tanacetum coccineum]